MPNSRQERLANETSSGPTHPAREVLLNENAKSAHVDTFAREHLPPLELWPAMTTGDLSEFNYPARLNAAFELLDGMVEKGFGARPCLRTDDGVWSYAKLLDRSNRIANLLVQEGLLTGERVLLRDANTPMLAACWFGVLKAGGIAVTTMPQLRAHELSAIVNKARTRFALCAELLAEELHKTRQVAPALEKAILYGTENDQGEEPARFIAAQSRQFATVRTSRDDVALVAFSSGTSGEPKATVHFHHDLLAVCDSFSKYVLKPQPDDIFCGSPPLAFTFGLGGLLLFPMRIGASTLLLPKVTAEGLLAAIQRHGCSVCFTAPTLYRGMLEHVPRFNISSLKKCVSAGETLPLAVFEAWRKATGIPIIDGIGSTEMLHIFISASGNAIRPGATGKAVPGFEAKVVDDAGHTLPANTVGRLAVRGPTGCRYLDSLDLQRKYVQDGWNLTGDAYRMDNDGYFWYEGRTDDMIVSSGYKISALEIETALMSHPGVKECAVVGSPSRDRGEIAKAFVVLAAQVEGSDGLRKELQEHVKAQIAPYKYPRAIEFVPELPRTSTGKLQRGRLREQERRNAELK
jgi:2-aminobenzoate-CoA ligase